MNKNNTSIPSPNQPLQSRSKNKNSEGRSEFTRVKLQREYEPKLRAFFKHKLPKTTEQQKDMQQRIQRQKEEELVAISALQCFKKGQLINIDWKTRSNFRKSQLSVKLPRINTESLQIKNQHFSNNKSNRSHIFESRHIKSLKNKEIQNKVIKLKQLLNPKKSERYLRNKTEQIIQTEEIFNQKDNSIINESKSREIQLKDIIVSSQVQGHSENLNSFLNQQKLIPDESFKFVSLRSQTEEIKHLKHFQKDFLHNSERDNSLKQKNHSIQSNIDSSSSLYDDKPLQNKNSTFRNIDQPISNSLVQSKKKNEEHKLSQNYDILNDPGVYLLISKSRDKLITWKQNFALESMTQIERLKFLQEMGHKSFERYSSQEKSKERATSLEFALLNKKVQKEKFQQKIDGKKRLNSQKMSKKFKTRVFTETEQFLRQSALSNSADHSQICLNLDLKSPKSSEQKLHSLFKPKQSKIRQRKKESLVEVQQKLLKKVKLSFLKEDLTKKFEEIRTEQK